MQPRIIKPIALYSLLALAIAGCGGGSGGSGSSDAPAPVTPSNTAPVAQDDDVSVLDRTAMVTLDVLANDSDADGDQLNIASVSASAEGVTPSIVDGAIAYTLPPDFAGDDTFTYTVSDGEDEATATVTISIAPGLTLAGALAESGLGDGELELRIGASSQSASISGVDFSIDIPVPAADDLILATATFASGAGNKPVILKSYIGSGEQLAAAAVDGRVSEHELPMLYLSAASTSAAALIERAAQVEVTTVDQLLEASQVLPQDLLLDIALKSVIAGDSPNAYTQPDSYALLQSFPVAMEIAEALKASNSEKYAGYRAAILADTQQSSPMTLEAGTELLFIEGPSWILRPYGFALQVSDSNPGEAYLAENHLHKADNNKRAFTATDRVINLDTTDLFATETNTPENQAACQASMSGLYESAPVAREIVRFLDTPVFSAYSVVDTHECLSDGSLFDTARYFQVNNQGFGDFTPLISGKFALSTYRDVDGTVYRDEPRWHAVINSPNGTGGITQRFELKNGYSDAGTLSLQDDGRLIITSQRGDTVEYVALGNEGAALKTLAILRRADGSIASVGGDMIVPVTDGIAVPVPGKLLYTDSLFSVVSPTSAYHDTSYGFDFGSDNRGIDLDRVSTSTFEDNLYGFSWSAQSGYLDLRYFYDRDSHTYQDSCPPAAANCEEYRMREFEALYQYNGDYYIRVYNETDYSALYGVSLSPSILQYSYIDRFTPVP